MPLKNPLELCLLDEKEWLIKLFNFATKRKDEIIIHWVGQRIETVEIKIKKLNAPEISVIDDR